MSENVSWSGQTVLITGASGFIGRHLVRALITADCTPVLMLRGSTDTGDARSVMADLSDLGSLANAVRAVQPDIVFHLGGFTDPGRNKALGNQAIATNVMATRVLAETSGEMACQAFVFTSTSEEYGNHKAPFHEDLPPNPLSPYSASKSMSVAWLKMLHDSFDFPAVITRPFLTYGPGQLPPKLVPSAVLAALAGKNIAMTAGLQMRELTYVGDLVRGLISAALTPKALGEIINLGSGDEHRIRDLVELIYDMIGKGGAIRLGAIKDRPNDMQRFIADTVKAKTVLGWEAQTPLKDGLQHTIDWAAEHGESPIPLGKL